MEPRGLEPLTPCLQSKCATCCAMAPVSSPMGPVDAMEFLLDKLKHSKTNNDFFQAMNT